MATKKWYVREVNSSKYVSEHYIWWTEGGSLNTWTSDKDRAKAGRLRRKLPHLSLRCYIEEKSMANEEYFDFEEVLDRINNLEVVVAELLKGPELNYKRPGATEYEKLADTLNYLHNKVSELESK